MALIQTNAQLLTAPQTGFINTGFTAQGEYDTYTPFTATQKPVYTATAETAESVSVIFNDGSWAHGGDVGFAITASSDLVNCLKVSALSAYITLTAAAGWEWDRENNIRYSYDSANIPDNDYCGRWHLNDYGDTAMTAIISGFGGEGALPTAYPVYLSFPYTTRDKVGTDPITISAISGIGEPGPAYPQYPLTSTGYFSTRTFCTGGWVPWFRGDMPNASGWHSAATVYDDGPDSASPKSTWHEESTITYDGYSDTWMYGIANRKKYDFQGDTGYTYATGTVQTAWRGYPSDSGSITP